MNDAKWRPKATPAQGTKCSRRSSQRVIAKFLPVHTEPRPIWRVNSGDVKGTITDAVPCHFVPNDVRRHRLISISYISLLPCHGSVHGGESADHRSFRHSGNKTW